MPLLRTIPIRTFTPLLLAGLATGCGGNFAARNTRALTGDPAPDTLVLTPIARLAPGARDEVSGIVRSRRDPAVFWTLNDSGNEPRVYAIRADGSPVPSVRYPDLPGTLIGGAIDCDWEDIALDASGRLIVADLGNNSNARADLCLYVVPEPEPTEGRTTFAAKILVRYPDQPSLPAPRDNFNFDCEGVFTVGDDVFILTKHRSDTFTKLYRLSEQAPGVVNTLEFLDRFDIGGQVTGADASPDGLTLAVLTYDSIWLFRRTAITQSFFDPAALKFRAAYRYDDGDSDSESICFENEHALLIADESRGTLYRARVDQIPPAMPR